MAAPDLLTAGSHEQIQPMKVSGNLSPSGVARVPVFIKVQEASRVNNTTAARSLISFEGFNSSECLSESKVTLGYLCISSTQHCAESKKYQLS